MSKNISHLITSICKENGICYTSLNPDYHSFVADAAKLGMIYRDLKIMIGDIEEIEERQDLANLSESMEKILQDLDNADHLIIKVAKSLQDKSHAS